MVAIYIVIHRLVLFGLLPHAENFSFAFYNLLEALKLYESQMRLHAE